ncbi:FHA domain-containing protein [Paenarthrobacter sp. NPDC089322]|uniref:FHA domain-containing protein n=1 Tax=Paenarthrobacter sp. NPDC089322 TaxID=3155065 RepID=UPI00344429CC
MIGRDKNRANVGNGEEEQPTSETTSISITPTWDEPVLAPRLAPEERASVDALPPDSALLIAHSGPNAGARFLLDSDTTTAGRHPDADIFLDDVTVSRKHVEFHRNANGFELVDMGSLNGTYVNHDRVDRIQLKTGNEVQIGKFRLTYYLNSGRAAGRG